MREALPKRRIANSNQIALWSACCLSWKTVPMWYHTNAESMLLLLLTFTWGGVHPVWIEPALSMKFPTAWRLTPQARGSCAIALGIFPQSYRHRAQPKTRSPEGSCRSSSSVVFHTISWPLACLHYVWGGVGRRRSLIIPPSGLLAAWPNRWSLLWVGSACIQVRERRSHSFIAASHI